MPFRTSLLAAAISLSLAAVPLATSTVTRAAEPATLTTLSMGDGTAGIAVDPRLRKAFVTNYDSGTLSVIDLDGRSVTAIDRAGRNPRRILSDAAHGRVYFVNDMSPGWLTVLDAEANATVAQIEVGNRPRNLAADFQRGEVYVANRDSNTLSVVDARENRVVATIPVGAAPGGIGIDALTGRIYVTSGPDRNVTVIDTQTRMAMKTIGVGRNPGSATVDERTGKVYVNNVDDATVSVIDPGLLAVARTLKVGTGSTFGTASTVYHRYYLPNAADGTLSIIDTDEDRVVDTLSVGASPQQAVIDPDAGALYVVNRDSNSISVIDARSEALVATHPVGAAPWRLAVHDREFLVLNENGAALDSLTIASGQRLQNDTAIAVEYHDKVFDHYFHSVDAVERRLLADGLFGDDLQRTMQVWRVWTAPAPGRFPVCGFSSGAGNAHFYTLGADDCEALKSSGSWQYEGIDYFVTLPDFAGECPPKTVALYRMQHNGQDGAPNHRFTASTDIRDAMRLKGWIPEGSGADHVFACVPPLRGAPVKSSSPEPDRRLTPPLPRLR